MAPRAPTSSSPASWIDALVDEGSFLPLKQGYGDVVTTGLARVDGRVVAVYAIDPGRDRGFVDSAGATKIAELMDRAEELGAPVVALLASAGVSVTEGLRSGEAYARVISTNVRLSGVVPQLALVMGVTMGAPAYSATLMDLTLVHKSRGHLMVTGPAVVQAMLGESPTLADLGGAEVHHTKTGLADLVCKDVAALCATARTLLSLLPENHLEEPHRTPPVAPARAMPTMPDDPGEAFDVRTVIDALADDRSVVELGAGYGPSMITVLARLEGRVVGVLANQSLESGGAITTDAADKSARFLRLCDAYGIPIVTLIDVPGFLPGVGEEQRGLLRRGASFCQAMRTAVPRVSVVVRRCYGAAAFLMMQTRGQDGDLVLALPGARIAVMGYDAAKHLVRVEGESDEAARARYFEEVESPARAVALGLVDAVVPAPSLRASLAAHLGMLDQRRPRRATPKRHVIPA